MARRKSFYDKIVQKVKRDVGHIWTGDCIMILKRYGTVTPQSAPEAFRKIAGLSKFRFFEREAGRPIVGDQLFRSLQREAMARRSDDEYQLNRGMPLPDPPLYPGLMVAWDCYPTTVQVDDDLIAYARESEADFADVKVDDLKALFPSCLLIDVRNRDVVMYDERVDALFVYPSYEADCSYDLLLIIGVSLRNGLFEPLCSKFAMQQELLGEAIEHTISERERLRKRCLSETDRGLHDEIFSPAEDEETIMLLATETLGLMLWGETAVDRHVSGRTTHLHVRRRKERESSFQAWLSARGEDAKAAVPDPKPGDTAGAKPTIEVSAKPTRDVDHAPDGLVSLESDSQTNDVPETGQAPSPHPETLPQSSPKPEPEPASSPEPKLGPKPKPTAAPGPESSPEPEPTPTLESEPSPRPHIDTEWERELLTEVERLTAQVSEQKAKVSSLTYHLRQLSDTLEQERSAASAEHARAEILETMDVPASPAEALLLAERAFADRLIVMECAHKSAREFVRGDTAEVWAILRSMAMVLHPMIFGRGGDNVVYAFRKQTGFELTLREMKMIKQVERLSKLRTVVYRGVEHDAAAHVKGRGRSRGETLRVHFFADYDEQRLVIAHCGEHLTTFDTAQL